MTTLNVPSYESTLIGLRRHSRLRELTSRVGVDFTSNDYLGLADSPRLKRSIITAISRGVPVGSGGSRLLRGNHPEHQELEAEAAKFFGVERVLYFPTGFAANEAIFSTLPQRGDLIVFDELIHASVHSGIAASKAEAKSAVHNDADAFEETIRAWRQRGGRGRPWLAIESLYSMDGDFGQIQSMFDVAMRHDGFLVIDEAHATGVFGPGGRGLAALLEGHERVIALHTCGKALGVSGALLASSSMLADYIVNRGRNFIYSTAPSPIVAAAVREALQAIEQEPERREKLRDLTSFAKSRLDSVGIATSLSQIMPVIVGDNVRAVCLGGCMQRAGFDVRAIRPPTVAEGTARLRISITLNVDEPQIAAMVDRLALALEEHPR